MSNAAFDFLLFLLLALSVPTAVEAIHKELYTTNAICRRRYCVNPIFPGLEDLHSLSEAKWVAASLQEASPTMSFCRGAVNYNPAIPAPGDGQAAKLAELVKKQEQAAITMYGYHLAGMGIEMWDHTKPSEDSDDCVKSVWRQVCYTYFPKAAVGVKPGEESKYLRPCQSSCRNYIRACGVECCDESVQCVFEHSKTISASEAIKTSGYEPHDGPSSVCTGGSFSGKKASWLLLALLLGSQLFQVSGLEELLPSRRTLKNGVLLLGLVAMTTTLQGCDVDVPSHMVGNWRGEPDYLISYEFIPPGASAADAKLNSCSFDRLAQTLQCNGRGVCKPWDQDNLHNPISFCDCDRDWADPECRTPRKSQLYAYFISLFFGFTGADLFYLGYPIYGSAKLCTLGGFGVWWLVDIIRIGSAPVYAHDFRVAADLPHWAFVLTAITYFFAMGFTIVGFNTVRHRRRKRKDAMLLQAEEEAANQGEYAKA